jgi:hypothetical protein
MGVEEDTGKPKGSTDGANESLLHRFGRWARETKGILENVAKGVIAVSMLGSMFIFGRATDPGSDAPFADRILTWSFVVFTVGMAELFVLFVVLSVIGKIDLAEAFRDKDGKAENTRPSSKAPVSLSRLQAFMWTLVVVSIYFHRVVRDQSDGLPSIPPELLMVMGISSAVYLASKGISASKTKADEGS